MSGDTTATRRARPRAAGVAGVVAVGLAVSVLVAFGLSRWASPEPDGLERVGADHGLDTEVRAHPLAESPLADYSTRGVDDEGTGTGLAGLLGVAAAFALATAIAALLGRRRPRPVPTDPVP